MTKVPFIFYNYYRNKGRTDMKYENTVRASFLKRPNRFIADVKLPEGKTERVHVKNTGRCSELLLPGSQVILCPGNNPERKTKYDLVTVYKKNTGWINIDSQIPNALVKEWLNKPGCFFENITYLKPEYIFGNSRIDFYIECGERKILLEVKGCTLEKDKTGYFPDAPTERGVKHLEELSRGADMGYECYVAFVIAINGVSRVLPNTETHPEFGEALENAKRHGVKALYLPCEVSENDIFITGWSL